MIHEFDRWYHNTLANILDANISTNARTGEDIRTLPCRSMTLSNVRSIPVLSTRRMYPKTAAAEVAWQLMGTQSIEWISKHCKIWNKFADDGMIEAAYGHRWRYHYGFDQIRQAVQKLEEDPSSRQAHIQTWDPTDMLMRRKNIPCPTSFTINIVDYAGCNRLHMTVEMRSSDFIMGLPYDVMAYALLQNAIANTLKVGVGMLQFSLAHAHVYEKHLDVAERMIKNYTTSVGENMVDQEFYYPKGWSITEIQNKPDLFVHIVNGESETHPYNPHPEIFV